MRHPVCYDVTHLVSRLGVPSPSGIDLVDLAYGRYFVGQGLGPFVHYGLAAPHILSHHRAHDILGAALDAPWAQPPLDADPRLEHVRASLIGGLACAVREPLSTAAPPATRRWPLLQRLRFRLARDLTAVPANAVYLNVAQHVLETPRFFRWLEARPDVRAVFLIHDLLPLDLPEYFRPGYKERFTRRMDTALGHGRGFIVTSRAVRARLEQELTRRGLSLRPILVAPLPSSLPVVARDDVLDPALSATPYFVTLGTIEPRKNHMLLLNVWRQLAEAGRAHDRPVPKLVIIGARGWENEQVLDILDRSAFAKEHIIEAKGLTSRGLARLVANARALLMPSFSEGYGMPLVEALALGTPVITTDAPVFREVTQGCALYRSPIDGTGWKEAIGALTDPGSETSLAARESTLRFDPPTWERHFAAVETFLDSV